MEGLMENFFTGMFTPQWFAALGSIILLDLVLSGDNAILIAMACKNLRKHRLKAILLGSVGAVIIRIICTIFAVELLSVAYISFLGGIAILYIAVKLLTDHGGAEDDEVHAAASLREAVKTILIADFLMSLDNVLALAGVANTVPEGKYSLIMIGLAITIPIMLCGSQFFLMVMQRFPVVVYAGGAILGYTAAEMMLLDRELGVLLEPFSLVLRILLTCGVLAIGWFINKKSCRQAA